MPETSQRLDDLACLRVGGSDRIDFLQGQLCSDLRPLGPERAGLTAMCNRQGRVLTLALAVPTEDAVMLVMPAAQLEDTLRRLRMYVLRAKVELDAPGTALPIAAVWSDPEGALPASAWAAAPSAAGHGVRLPGRGPRWLMIGAAGERANDGRWRLEDVRAGLPQVYPDTREQFLPQSLNLDALGGVSFDKGCYVGQEVIARLHFRGTVKRRMRLFRLAADATIPAPGSAVLGGGETVGKVVDAAAGTDEGAVLAVCPVGAPLDDCALEDGTPLAAASLPYSLPEA